MTTHHSGARIRSSIQILLPLLVLLEALLLATMASATTSAMVLSRRAGSAGFVPTTTKTWQYTRRRVVPINSISSSGASPLSSLAARSHDDKPAVQEGNLLQVWMDHNLTPSSTSSSVLG